MIVIVFHSREIEDDETEYPILGRKLECEEMKKLLHTVTMDERQAGLVQHMVIIEGEAGIGKTRLMEEFMDIAEDENFRSDTSIIRRSLLAFQILRDWVFHSTF